MIPIAKNINYSTAIFPTHVAIVTPTTHREESNMKVERTYGDNVTFHELLMPLINSEIDRLIEQSTDFQYNEGNANTFHSEGVA
ncbi:hypothetical protein [Paenibacillus pasadenensis]|uniref:hypothetical protein n=1 Tax=Paenibacillus pasadenensis TaxID=217090 RepID=UPI0011AF39CB|nr:hypothetical protein [Paenibacillus pasadenensis]